MSKWSGVVPSQVSGRRCTKLQSAVTNATPVSQDRLPERNARWHAKAMTGKEIMHEASA
jgi:hypothetical protein